MDTVSLNEKHCSVGSVNFNNSHVDDITRNLISPSDDPAYWCVDDATRSYISVNGISQNIETINFIKSKRTSKNVIRGVLKVHYRYCSLKLFYMVLINGEKVKRNYLVYSESTGSVFCAPCKLFGSTSVFSTVGFSDWKHAEKRITSHENSQTHKTNVLTMKDRGKVAQRIDSALILQIEGENNYWKNVLRRVVAVVKTLSSRGLAFRDKTDKFGCNQNGNFLMSLELIALFDPFLATHIEKFANKGKGFTSYLSFNIFEQFITVMADPDISHVDQLSFVVRYVKNDGTPIERFMCFLPNSGHKSEELIDEVLTMLSLFDLDPIFLRAQSYDNASNMAGAYSGLQARIKEINPLANFVPCAAHSLNLVGMCAASACREACDFFDIVQNIYNFFTASTHRWSELEGTLHEITPEKVREDAEVLQKTYPNDIATCFVNECVKFQGHIKNIEVKLSTIQMLQFIRKHDITSVYPYVEVALRILLCTLSTNCSAERSFSTLKRIKNYLRSTMAQDRCSALAVLAIETEITNSLDFEKIINDFATSEARKKKF
ncbi:zinc finger MYM-type protein 1-like [Melanaphis sacchari]|uniref:zinc finger MYM-type protein 1-like n=1 Tax=Melanaphis sacchari TaxID=742174 RepID=UPI000DC1355C|nr:zinc finger MYM-type protein 1-like [Melanaphis sacchari]